MRPFLEKTHHKKRGGVDGVTQGEGPEFRPQYHKKKTGVTSFSPGIPRNN
jgi:hypothetical protein